jgi:hypothetical protein
MRNVFYKYDYYGANDARALAHRYKENDLFAVRQVATEMVTLIPEKCYLIPVPNKYGHAHQNLSLANFMMMSNPRLKVFDIMKGANRESVYDAKKNGHPLNETDLDFFLTSPVPTGKRIFLVDNIIGTGLTAASAMKLIPYADLLVHSVDRQTFDNSTYRKQFAGVYLCDGNLKTIYDIADKSTNMKIELKNIEVYDRMSEETIAFVADIYINDFKAGFAKNDGRGGPTFCQGYNAEGYDLIRKAEAYCKTLPPQVFPAIEQGGQPFSIPMTFDDYVDDLVSKFQFERDMKRGILVGKAYNQYYLMEFNHPIDTILKNRSGVEFIKKTVRDVAGRLEEGQRILNTNLPDEVMQVVNRKEVKPDIKNTSPEKKITPPGKKSKSATRKQKPR